MKTMTLVIFFLASISISNVLGQGNGNVGIGTVAPAAKLQVNHKSTLQTPTIIMFDSTGGTGSKVSFRKQGSNQEFEVSYDGANLNYNPKEVGVDKSVPWQFKANGSLVLAPPIRKAVCRSITGRAIQTLPLCSSTPQMETARESCFKSRAERLINLSPGKTGQHLILEFSGDGGVGSNYTGGLTGIIVSNSNGSTGGTGNMVGTSGIAKIKW